MSIAMDRICSFSCGMIGVGIAGAATGLAVAVSFNNAGAGATTLIASAFATALGMGGYTTDAFTRESSLPKQRPVSTIIGVLSGSLMIMGASAHMRDVTLNDVFDYVGGKGKGGNELVLSEPIAPKHPLVLIGHSKPALPVRQ